jgi:hypothetical protein
MRTACAAKRYVRTLCAYCFCFCVLFGAGAQRLLRFGGSKNVLSSRGPPQRFISSMPDRWQALLTDMAIIDLYI